MTQQTREGVEGFDQTNFEQWLRSELLAEREAIELRHRLVLDELTERLAQMLNPQTQQNHSEFPEVARATNENGEVLNPCDENHLPSPHEKEVRPSRTIEIFQPNNPSKKPDVWGQSAKREGYLYSLVTCKQFELFWAAVIIFNLVVMAVESHYLSFDIGFDIDYPEFTESKEDMWPAGGIVFFILDLFFGILYTIELGIKMLGLASDFIEIWNILDVVIVVLWYVDRLFNAIPVNLFFLRLLRLTKLLRLAKLAKAMQSFDELFLVLTSLRGSLKVMGWSCFLLLSSLASFAFLMNQTIVNLVLLNGHHSDKTKETSFRYFGSFTRSFLSMFELTLANCVPISRFLFENVSPIFIAFAVFYKLTFGFTVIGIINSCFIKETFKHAAQDDLVMVLEKNNEIHVQVAKMKHFFSYGDTSGDGFISLEELQAICQEAEIKAWLAAQGIDASDVKKLWALLDSDNSGQLSIDLFTKGLARLKGPARSLDMEHLFKQDELREERMLLKEERVSKQLAELARQVDMLHNTCVNACRPGVSEEDSMGTGIILAV